MKIKFNKDNPLKFSKATPKEISKGILKIYNPKNGVTLTSNQIIQDVKRVLTSLETILEAGGRSCRA